MSDIDPATEKRLLKIFENLEQNAQFKTLAAIRTLADKGQDGISSDPYSPAERSIVERLSQLDEMGFLVTRGEDDGTIPNDIRYSLPDEVAAVAKKAITIGDPPYNTTVVPPQRGQGMVDRYAPRDGAGPASGMEAP